MAGGEVAGRISANVLGAEPANNVQVKPHKYCLIDVCSTFYCIYGVFNERASWLQQGHKKGKGRGYEEEGEVGEEGRAQCNILILCPVGRMVMVTSTNQQDAS